ncbi:Uncharacterised protein [Streptococcus pseudopneumoniae]|uniref:Uncharacterized protein n=1 Tax=Streptococcus pseudopneumoniae TaxID=257758 RepID=A0A0T8U8L8_9STRE|nr:Uncharacterised protein [Streptococcus pseudopneumoniae]
MANKGFKNSYIDRKKLSSSLKTLMTQRKELEEFLKDLL